MGIKIENIIFLICIGLILFVALWMLHGSPTDIAAIISIALFVATSEVLLWKELFKVERRTEKVLMRVESKMDMKFVEFDYKFKEVDRRFSAIDKELAVIKDLIKSKL